jgi:hypothetical protein
MNGVAVDTLAAHSTAATERTCPTCPKSGPYTHEAPSSAALRGPPR